MWCKLYLSVFILLISLFTPIRGAGAENIEYLSVIPDVPIYSGMKEDLSQTVSFDKASGRVVDTVIQGENLNKNRVIKFYFDSLTGLGWLPEKENVFIRENEQLIVKARENGDRLIVEFSLIPKIK